MKILLIISPRKYWPFVSEQDNFLVPQALPYLGAVLRENGFEIKLLDCMPLKIGWKSLAKIIAEYKPDIIGAGENHALYANEALKVFELAKAINPNIRCIAGGAHFSNLIEETLKNKVIDFIVRGEGEYTFLELVKAISGADKEFGKIKGIAYLENGETILTPSRPLIDNLDELPFPAYDLLPMEKYGSSKFLYSPGGTTIHHSRGCISSCKFCSWWLQMATEKIKDGKRILEPRWRTKSVGNTINEIEVLYKRYKKHCLVFVDESWNIDAQWNDTFSEKLIQKHFKLKWFAFLRLDCVMRDLKNGIFDKMVKSGLTHMCIGAERCDNEWLDGVGKKFYSDSKTKECMDILNKKYPHIFKQVTFIVGVRDESKESMYRQIRFAKELKVDFPAFHPLTPVPGTQLWQEALKNNWLETKDFANFDWATPVMPSRFLTRQEISSLIYEANKEFINIRWLLKGLLSRDKYKRNIYIWWFLVTIRLFFDAVLRLLNPFRREIYTNLVKPKWYDK